MYLEYEFEVDDFDGNERKVEWQYELSDNDIEEFLVEDFSTKKFANLLYNTGYLKGDDEEWMLDYWRELFDRNFASIEHVRDYIANMNSMSDVLYYFNIEDTDFDWLVDADEDLKDEIKEYFQDRAREEFDKTEYDDDTDFDFVDDATFYAYKEGPGYWRR